MGGNENNYHNLSHTHIYAKTSNGKEKIPFRIKALFYAERKQRNKTGTLSFIYHYSRIQSFISIIDTQTPKVIR
jgi:hypothetical protein